MSERPNLHVVSCYFNPCNFGSRLENFRNFRDAIARPITAVELSFTGEFQVATEPQDIRIVGDIDRHFFWQKEAMINLAARELSAERLAWVDGDVYFTDADWYERTQELLDRQAFCQLFDVVVQPSETREPRYGLHFFHRGPNPEQLAPHPGYAWAARVDAFDLPWVKQGGGLPEKHIVGGGDGVTARYLRGHHGASQLALPGSIVHMPHGNRKDRRYVARKEALARAGYDPARDIERCPDTGLLRWSRLATDSLRETVSSYFVDRDEDRYHRSKSVMVKQEQSTAAVIASWRRPSNVRMICTEYEKTPEVSDVVVVHGDPYVNLRLAGEKLRLISRKYTLTPAHAWLHAADVPSEFVVLQADDTLLSGDQIDRLVTACRNQKTLVGNDGYNRWCKPVLAGSADHLRLGAVCGRPEWFATAYAALLKWRDTFGHEFPVGRSGRQTELTRRHAGSGIFLSRAVADLTGKPPFVVSISGQDLPTPHALSSIQGILEHKRAVRDQCDKVFPSDEPNP